MPGFSFQRMAILTIYFHLIKIIPRKPAKFAIGRAGGRLGKIATLRQRLRPPHGANLRIGLPRPKSDPRTKGLNSIIECNSSIIGDTNL
jgi:hypothetical protein